MSGNPVDATWRSDPRASGESAHDPTADAGELAPGARLGRYVVRRLLGRGGMGVVYLADQVEPVHRPVALKLIQPTFRDSLAEAYFEVERQALAHMDHPAIAKVLEAGTTPQGLPFFAMEWIDGSSLGDYLQGRRANLATRLELMRQIALGAQHAHQRGVVHRDLKPDNVLIAEVDGRALPKIIDFGIAIGVEHAAKSDTDYAGTSIYMSPEQAGISDATVDVRSDVYSLGVMLLEVLAPHGTLDALRERGIGASRLSRVLLTQDEASTARHDATEWLSLPASRTIPRELRLVIARATALDHDQRYASAQAFADDLQRFAQMRPLEAVPRTRPYLTRKFIQRHRYALLASGGIAAALLLGLVATLYGLVQARAERARAEQAAITATTEARRSRQMADFLANVLSGVDPERAKSLDKTLMHLVLDEAGAQADRTLHEDPALLADIQATIGRSYRSLDETDRARDFLERALQHRRAILGSSDRATLETERLLVGVASESGKYAEALKSAQDLHARARAALGADDVETLRDRLAVGWEAYLTGDFKLALAELEPATQRLRELLGAEHLDVLDAELRFGVAASDSGHFDLARTAYASSVEGFAKVLGAGHPRTLSARNSVGVLALQERRYADAADELGKILPLSEAIYGPNHLQVLMIVSNMAGALRMQGKVAESGPYYQRAYESFLARSGPDNPSTLIAENNYANYLIDVDKANQSATLMRDVLTRAAKSLPDNRVVLSEFHFTSGKALLALQRWNDAEAELQWAWDARVAELGADNADTRDVAARMAQLHRAEGRSREAESWDERAAAKATAKPAVDRQ
ncbi:MAG: serine/threonine-protein kinase [Tahibacter sp.]